MQALCKLLTQIGRRLADFAKTNYGKNTFILCEKLGKLPHELETCTEEELIFLYTAMMEVYGEKK